jgi:hypothetical protein
MDPNKTDFKQNASRSLAYMRENPNELEKKNTTMTSKLTGYMKSSGQGSANKVTDHEANIAEVFETNGFTLAPRRSLPEMDGYYYVYQSGGSQQKGDFLLFWILDGEIKSKIILDAKHSNSKSIYLNDGWFETDTIYIVSFNAGTKKYPKYTCLIGLGKDIPTESDSKVMSHIIEIKKELNKSKKTMLTNFLSVVFRFANQYSCKQFTDEFSSDRFQKTLAWLEP